MEHPLVASIGKIVGYNAPFVAISTLAPGIDIAIKMVVGLVAVIGTLHTMYTNQKRLENELKNKQDGKRKSE